MSGILERLHKWRWQRRVKKTLTGKVYKMAEHQGWGHRISVHGDLTMDGHGMGLKVGDEIRVPLRTGETARTMVVEVRYMKDPPDMFLGRVGFIGMAEGDVKGDRLGMNNLIHVGPGKWV